MTELPRFSASKIQKYQKCPSDYISHYLLGMRPAVETTWGIFGTACHSAIQAGYEGTGFPYDVALDVVNKRFAELETVPYIGYTRGQIIDKANTVLDDFDYDLFSPRYMEYEFNLPFKVGGETVCTIHGFIDLITTDNKVIDFKTNSKPQTQKEVNSSIQLALYAWAYKELWGDWPGEVAIYHLPTSRLIRADMYQLRDLLPVIESLVVKMMLLTPDTPIEPCKYCNPFCALKDWGQSS